MHPRSDRDDKKERNCKTSRYAKILGEGASLHEYPLIPMNPDAFT